MFKVFIIFALSLPFETMLSEITMSLNHFEESPYNTITNQGYVLYSVNNGDKYNKPERSNRIILPMAMERSPFNRLSRQD